MVSLWDSVSVLLSSTSFVCGCLPGFSPFGVASGFPWVSPSIYFPLSFRWFPPFRPRSLRLTFHLFSLFPWCLSAVSGLGLHSLFPSCVVSVPALPLSLSVRAALFLASVFSSLRPLHPAFQFFLVCILAGSSSSPLLPRLCLCLIRFSGFP